MSIINELNLTPEQARKVHQEMERQYHIDDISSRFDSANKPIPDEQTLNKIADEFEYLNGKNDTYYEEYWQDIDDAIKRVVK